MARGFAAAADSLVFADLNDKVRELAAKFLHASANVHSLVFDVIDEAAIAGAYEQIMQRYSRFDVVVNNADVIVRTPLLELTRQKWQKVMDTDLTACFFWWPSKPRASWSSKGRGASSTWVPS